MHIFHKIELIEIKNDQEKFQSRLKHLSDKYAKMTKDRNAVTIDWEQMCFEILQNKEETWKIKEESWAIEKQRLEAVWDPNCFNFGEDHEEKMRGLEEKHEQKLKQDCEVFSEKREQNDQKNNSKHAFSILWGIRIRNQEENARGSLSQGVLVGESNEQL